MAKGASLGQPTSAGTYALRNATALKDSFLVAQARRARLIILVEADVGETDGNNEVNNRVQKILTPPINVKSTHDLAVSVSVGFALFSISTETLGSTSCPVSFTSKNALRSSKGLSSCSGIYFANFHGS
ncbi:uncharacterized protein RSE6_07432 [Rhynchosporium secalis]|uniref:Amidase domain-containing protein n=1 Tax=Rhynchosporium secalis TaxID=38038 RepID=A0A1E1MCT8_RHYSE|nr:uncharacterized protein RSE6_07432 [Rhynchosporium secalis]